MCFFIPILLFPSSLLPYSSCSLPHHRFDCIKSVIQTLPDDAPREHYRMKYIATENYRKFGASFFFRGLGTTLVRAVPVNAVTFLIYEETLKAFKTLEGTTITGSATAK